MGIFIGQDIWQRVFTARSIGVAKWGGFAAGIYCIIWGVMGGIIGMTCRIFFPDLSNPDTAFMAAVQWILPVGLRGIVIAASLAALMSTASACMMATSTIFIYDLYSYVFGKDRCTIKTDRFTTLVFGILILIFACLIGNIIAALTVAYNILVGTLLIPLIGAISWRRASTVGAISAITISGITIIFFMFKDGLLANSSIYYGLSVNLIVFAMGSLLWPDAINDKVEHNRMER